MKIGDIITANINHSEGAYKKGDQFPLEGLYFCDGCGKEMVDIGLPENGHVWIRCECGRGTPFFGRRLFWKSNFSKSDEADAHMSQLIQQTLNTL